MNSRLKILTETARKHPVTVFSALLVCLYAVGTAGHILPATRGLMLLMTPWFLLVTGAAALILAWPEEKRMSFALWAAVAYLVTFTLEAVGTATGLVFGPYTYGTVLGFHLFAVPPVIGFNWVLVILAFADLACRLPGGRWYGPVLAAAAATGFDWIMEPAAIGLGYWTWTGGAIPLQNYLAWFLIALVAATAWSLLGLKARRPAAAVLTAVQALFFLILRLTLF